METVDITKMWEANKSPLVTGITLCYNKLDFCQPAIESLAAWNGLGDEFEYVVWDNGSPYPGVAEYVEALKGRDGIEVMGGGFNVGVGAGLNRVIENTDSEFVFKFDDDCTILPWTLPAMVIAYTLAASHGYPIGVMSSDVIGIGKAHPPYIEAEIAPGIVLQGAWCVGGGAVLISRQVLEDVGPFDESRLYGTEDGDFAARAIKKGYQNCYLRDAYHISKCRGEGADKNYDDWKLYYHAGNDLRFEEWLEKKGE